MAWLLSFLCNASAVLRNSGLLKCVVGVVRGAEVPQSPNGRGQGRDVRRALQEGRGEEKGLTMERGAHAGSVLCILLGFHCSYFLIKQTTGLEWAHLCLKWQQEPGSALARVPARSGVTAEAEPSPQSLHQEPAPGQILSGKRAAPARHQPFSHEKQRKTRRLLS